MSVVLWHIEVSHYSEKIRWALSYKGIEHERRTPIPGLHGFVAGALTRGKQRRLPVVAIDGKRIGDSTAIVAALENYKPEPALYPADPAQRARALELEEFFDEQLAPEVRRLIWHHTLDDSDAVVDALITNGSPARKRVMRSMGKVARPIVRKDYGVSADTTVTAERKIREAMDRIERELQPSGYLVGDRFSIADLTAAALSTPLICPPEREYAPLRVVAPVQELRDELSEREAGKWIFEMFARHRGASTAVPA